MGHEKNMRALIMLPRCRNEMWQEWVLEKQTRTDAQKAHSSRGATCDAHIHKGQLFAASVADY